MFHGGDEINSCPPPSIFRLFSVKSFPPGHWTFSRAFQIMRGLKLSLWVVDMFPWGNEHCFGCCGCFIPWISSYVSCAVFLWIDLYTIRAWDRMLLQGDCTFYSTSFHELLFTHHHPNLHLFVGSHTALGNAFPLPLKARLDPFLLGLSRDSVSR